LSIIGTARESPRTPGTFEAPANISTLNAFAER